MTDQYGGSIWLPPLDTSRGVDDNTSSKAAKFYDDGVKRPILTLTFKNGTHDVGLVCLTSGITSSFERYINWGRIRTIAVQSQSGDEPETTILESMSESQFQNLQVGAHDLGKTNSVQIELLDVYSGQLVESHDPDVCAVSGDDQFPGGCIAAASPKTGISELVLYENPQS